MPSLQEVVEKLRPILDEYSAQLTRVEEQIRKTGMIDLASCGKCPRKSIEKVMKFGPDNKRAVSCFFDWIKNNDVGQLSSTGDTLAFRSSKKRIGDVDGFIPMLEMGEALGASTEK